MTFNPSVQNILAIQFLIDSIESKAKRNRIISVIAQCELILKNKRSSSPHAQRYIAGVIYLNRMNAPWRMLPKCFGHWKTVYSWWSRNGSYIVDQFEQFLSRSNVAYLDSSYVNCTPAANRNMDFWTIGQTAGGTTTKLSCIINHKSQLLDLCLTAGSDGDNTIALYQHNIAKLADSGINTLVADAAYYGLPLQEVCAQYGIRIITPTRGYSRLFPLKENDVTFGAFYPIYRTRGLIENFFNIVKRYPRIALRRDGSRMLSSYIKLIAQIG